jgi:16S rRNA (adenine1518-N6/adenine1519-N6)-dimethyltransferase
MNNNVIAKKRFGQNFLKNETILDKIIESIPNTQHLIVEIGTGLGDLTSRLLSLKKDVKSYEIDKSLYKIIYNRFYDDFKSSRLELIESNVLDCWKNSINLVDCSYDLVANLPYNIAIKVILNALLDDNCKNILVMVQLEVAEKICAKVGDRKFSSLSLIVESYGNCELLFKVPPESFYPIPKVNSAVISITKDKNAFVSKEFWNFLKYSFVQPRKKLVKNLANKFSKNDLQIIFKTLNLSLDLRPHEISLSIYNQIFKLLKE